MKTCPTCKRTYPDDAPPFCAEDGTRLITEPPAAPAPPVTVASSSIQAPAEPAKQNPAGETSATAAPPGWHGLPPHAPPPTRTSRRMGIATIALALGFVCMFLMIHLAYRIGGWGWFGRAPLSEIVFSFHGIEFLFGVLLVGLTVVLATVAIVMAFRQPTRFAGRGRSLAAILMAVLSTIVVVTMFTFRRFERRPGYPVYPSTTDSITPSASNALELIRPTYGNFKLLNSSREVTAPNPQLGLLLFMDSKDAAEGVYGSPANPILKLIVLKYETPSAAVSVVSRVRQAMRNSPNRVSSLPKSSGEALVAEGSNSIGIVIWSNSQWVFLTSGDISEAKTLAQAVGY